MPHSEKAALRRTFRAIRCKMQQQERDLLDATLVTTVQSLTVFRKARALIAYWPTKGEANLTPLFDTAKALHIPVYLPRVERDGMHFYRFEGADMLTPDRFGIPSPIPACPLPADTADMLCILPGLAADKSGYRLGYGGGFYDRFLCTYRGETLFPLYHRFVVDALPHEPHDMKVHLIITEKGVLHYGKMDTPAPTV